MEADDPDNNIKRDAPSANLPSANGTLVVNDGKVGSMVNQFEAPLSSTATPPSPVHVRDTKRMKQFLGQKVITRLLKIWRARVRGPTRLNECHDLELSRSGHCLDSQRAVIRLRRIDNFLCSMPHY
jgi:hypothetical protein